MWQISTVTSFTHHQREVPEVPRLERRAYKKKTTENGP